MTFGRFLKKSGGGSSKGTSGSGGSSFGRNYSASGATGTIGLAFIGISAGLLVIVTLVCLCVMANEKKKKKRKRKVRPEQGSTNLEGQEAEEHILQLQQMDGDIQIPVDAPAGTQRSEREEEQQKQPDSIHNVWRTANGTSLVQNGQPPNAGFGEVEIMDEPGIDKSAKEDEASKVSAGWFYSSMEPKSILTQTESDLNK